MSYEDVLKALAPCGLSCAKCFAFRDGEIAYHARMLRERLGAFDVYARRFSAFWPVFEKYPEFKELLEFLGSGDCLGCRQGTCGLPGCGVPTCCREAGVDFCFQCREFPCDRTSFDPHLKKRWIAMNERMKEIGAEAYFEETRDLPRYR